MSIPHRLTAAAATIVLTQALVSGACSPAAARTTSAGGERHFLLLLSHPSAALSRFTAAVSDPGSARYRQYMTIEQLRRRFGAPARTRHAVMGWLHAHRLSASLDPTGTYVEVTVGHSQPDALSLASVTHAGTFSVGLPVPRGLRGAVTEVVDGQVRLPVPRAATGGDVSTSSAAAVGPVSPSGPTFDPHGSSVRPRTGTPAGCTAGISASSPALVNAGLVGFTPNQYLTAYGFPRLIREDLRGEGERVAVVEFGGFKASDVTTFARCFGLPVPHLNVIPIAGGHALAPLDETTLDLEVLTAASPRARSIDVYESTGNTTTSFVGSFAEPLRQRARRPNVESVSYGVCEPKFAGMVPVMNEVNAVLEFEAAAGISVLASSGDTGSSGCALNQNTAALPLRAVEFPSSSPYATAVGGLNFTLTRTNRLATELVWNNSPLGFGAGGGGSSLVFRRPAWQRGPGTSGVNRTVPDVAMLADNAPGFAIYCTPPACNPGAPLVTPGWEPIGGTSAAAPLLAGGIADADQEAAAHHQPPLGFLNPLLYGSARRRASGVIHDVVLGGDDLGALIDGMPIGCCSAHRRYDYASGLGSVNLDALSRAGLRAYRQQHPGP